MANLRATTSTGAVLDSPTATQLASLVSEVSRAGDGAFLILERGADPSGQTYVQVLAERRVFVVEFRDRTRERHLRAEAADAATVTAVLTSWASGSIEWLTALPWQPVAELTRPQSHNQWTASAGV
jgi:hypothetical protein